MSVQLHMMIKIFLIGGIPGIFFLFYPLGTVYYISVVALGQLWLINDNMNRIANNLENNNLIGHHFKGILCSQPCCHYSKAGSTGQI